ncbi:MAG: acyltransferase [Burkholderiaceae bacterium]
MKHADFLAQKHFGSLDGLRAFSVIAVIWHHTAPQMFANTPLSWVGSQGVTLFFAISGFLITTLLLRERERMGRIDLKAFYWRRTLRIFPLYYAVLLLYIALVWLLERKTVVGQEFFNNLKYFASYSSNLFVEIKPRVIFYFSWSLAAEEQFYLVWPPLLVLLRRTGAALWFMTTLALVLIVDEMWTGFTLSPIALAIVAGSLLALCLHIRSGFERLRLLLAWRAAPLLWMLLLGLALSASSMPSFVIHLLCVALVGACVVREDHWLAPVLQNSMLSYIGSISYGIYLLHLLSANLVKNLLSWAQFPTQGWLAFPLTVGISILLAGLSFRFYESKFLRLKQRHTPQ